MSELSREKLLKVISILKKTYPAAKCALEHVSPLELLVATILSAQCTDERVNLVTRGLFAKYRTIHDYADADPKVFEKEIKPTGFFRNKTKNIIGCAKTIVSKHGGEIPRNIDVLTALPGVGRKTANVILGAAFGIASGIVVDTHVKRLSNRLGLTTNDDPEKIEQDLIKKVHEKNWIIFSHLLIFHGRNRCPARKPDCPDCEISEICPKVGVSEEKG